MFLNRAVFFRIILWKQNTKKDQKYISPLKNWPLLSYSTDHCCAMMCFNFVVLTACEMMLKLRHILFTHSKQTSAKVWAVTWKRQPKEEQNKSVKAWEKYFFYAHKTWDWYTKLPQHFQVSQTRVRNIKKCQREPHGAEQAWQRKKVEDFQDSGRKSSERCV